MLALYISSHILCFEYNLDVVEFGRQDVDNSTAPEAAKVFYNFDAMFWKDS